MCTCFYFHNKWLKYCVTLKVLKSVDHDWEVHHYAQRKKIYNQGKSHQVFMFSTEILCTTKRQHCGRKLMVNKKSMTVSGHKNKHYSVSIIFFVLYYQKKVKKFNTSHIKLKQIPITNLTFYKTICTIQCQYVKARSASIFPTGKDHLIFWTISDRVPLETFKFGKFPCIHT